MKISKSKQALADAIHQNGGWPSDEANFAAQDKIDGESNDNTVSFYSGKVKPTRRADCSMWRCEDAGSHFMGYEKTIKRCKLLPNWHQTCLSREEYYQAYPKADADGWIEWKGGECPVGEGVLIDAKKADGSTELAIHDPEDRIWGDTEHLKCIIAYRLHKQEQAEPEFCESVMRSTPEQQAKPTIEQLAADYRNKLDYVNRKQDEADKANMESDAALSQLEDAIAAIGFAITPLVAPEKEPELGITVQVGDEVECVKPNIKPGKYKGMIGTVLKVDDSSTPYLVNFEGEDRIWCHEVKFIRRP